MNKFKLRDIIEQRLINKHLTDGGIIKEAYVSTLEYNEEDYFAECHCKLNVSYSKADGIQQKIKNQYFHITIDKETEEISFI